MQTFPLSGIATGVLTGPIWSELEMFRSLALPFLFLSVLSVYFYTASGRAILDDGDALYAHVAQQMVERGDWVTPYADGVRFLDKPPLMYWLMGTAYKIFGTNEFAARFPSALAVLGMALLLYSMGSKAGGPASGLVAGLAAAFCTGTFLFTRMVFPDILFVFFLTLSFWAFLKWYEDERNPPLPALLFYGALAGAVLSKGLIGIFFPVAIIALFAAISGNWRRVRIFHIGKGILLFLALVLPWHLLAAYRNPGFLWYFFVNEQILRFLGRRQPMDYESISLPLFWVLILLWFFPWSAFFPAIGNVLKSKSPRASKRNAEVWLCASWVLVVLIFFSFSSRIEHYALPLFPPLALLVGLALRPEDQEDSAEDCSRHRMVSRGFGFLGILGGIFALLLLAAGIAQISGKFHEQSAHQLGADHFQAYKYYFAPLFDLPEQVLRDLMRPMIRTLLTLSVGLLSSWWMNKRGLRMPAVIVLSGTMMLFCFFAFHSLGLCEEMISSKQFGTKIGRLYHPGDSLITVGDFETANSINFYAPIPLYVYGGTAALLDWGLRYPDAPARILAREDLDSRWFSPRRVFLLASDDRIAGLRLNPYYTVMQSAGRTLICNQPIN